MVVNCYHCDELTDDMDMTTVHNDQHICSVCIHDQYKRCDGCDELFDKDEMLYIGQDSSYWCQPCQREFGVVDPNAYPSWASNV